MGAIKEVSSAAMPYLILAGVAGVLYLYRDKIWDWVTKNPVSDAVDDYVKKAEDNASDDQKRVDEMNNSDYDYFTKWKCMMLGICPAGVSPVEVITELDVTHPIGGESITGGLSPSEWLEWEVLNSKVEPAKPITGPVNPSLDPWSLPDEVIYQQKYAGIVAGFAPYSPGFDIIAEKGSRILFRSDNSWGIIDTSMIGIGGEPGKQVMAGSRGSGIPFGAW
jgi:hypothetical protein